VNIALAQLPSAWESQSFADVVDFTKRPPNLAPRGDVPFLPMALISEASLDLDEYEMRPPERAKSGTYFEDGDLLVARITPCFENGKQGLVTNVPGGWGMATTEVYALRSQTLTHEFLSLYLRSRAVRDTLIGRMEGATGRMRLPKEALEQLQVPVPPPAEQEQIVKRLGALLAELTNGSEGFRRALGGLDDYRRACLAAAFDGPVRTLDEVAFIQSGIAKGRPSGDDLEEAPYIRTANVQALRLDLSEIKTLAVTPTQREKHQLRVDDVLVLEGGDADKVGRGWIWSGEVADCLHQNHVFAVRPHANALVARYLAYYVNAPQARRYFLQVAKQTTNLASINKANLRALPLPVPSVEIQRRVVADLDKQLHATDETEAGLKQRLQDADVLRDSLLDAAVSGQLSGP